MKLCKDCKFYIPPTPGRFGRPAECNHPKVAYFSLVDGSTTPRPCSMGRDHGQACDTTGLHWEAKDGQ